MKSIVSVLLISFLIIGCSSNKKPKEYVSWVDDIENGLIKTQIKTNSIITCKYTPAEYHVLKQFSPNNIDQDVFQSEFEGISNMYHFIIRFEKIDGTNFLKNNNITHKEFQSNSLYLSYDIRQDLKLVQGLDTVVCALNHHERTYNNTPYEQILLSFPKSSKSVEDLTIILNDRVFGFNRVKFFFPKGVLKNIPTLTFE